MFDACCGEFFLDGERVWRRYGPHGEGCSDFVGVGLWDLAPGVGVIVVILRRWQIIVAQLLLIYLSGQDL